ncbi:MAG: SH3 domain-containing protein [Treponema sp.]|nr:SH3 domain-containing protein [Treponema sp.]
MKKIVLTLALITMLFPMFAKTSGVMLRTRSPLREDDGNGGAKWSIEVPAGTVVDVESETPVLKTLITSKESTPNISFIKVTYQKKSYLALASEIAVGGDLSVVLDDTTLFMKPTMSAFLNARLDKLSYVVAGKKVSKNGLNFVEVKYWSDSAWTIRTRYVLAKYISSKADDVKAMQILDKIAEVKDESMKKTLIDSAKSLKTSDAINEAVTSVYNKIYGIVEEAPVEAAEDDYEVESDPVDSSVYYGRVATDDGSRINLRTLPSTSGSVVGQIDDDTIVTLIASTKGKYTIDGIEDFWYQVSANNMSGWLFGGYLKIEEF